MIYTFKKRVYYCKTSVLKADMVSKYLIALLIFH